MTYNKLALVLGNCLFADHVHLQPDDKTLFFMAEDYGLCTHFCYHKHKIVLFLSAMRSHRDDLQKKYAVEYHELNRTKSNSFETKLLSTLKKNKIKQIITYEIEDHFFSTRIDSLCVEHNITLTLVDSPSFLTSKKEFIHYRSSYKRLFMKDFYQWQRKRLNILMDGNQPLSGRWSYDEDNRKKLPKSIEIPSLPSCKRTDHSKTVSTLVNNIFEDHPGTTENFYLPTTRSEALKWLDVFLQERFSDFGPYEDALSIKHPFVFHSLLSPLINLGLLTPAEVVQRSLDYAQKHDTPLQSVEGFIRQIIGWREFIRGVYNTEPLGGNFFNQQRALTSDWYEGTTGIEPLDHCIKHVQQHGYLHHIERLMVVGNLMLLVGIHPQEAYRWFMELFVDSSDWVMAPNVFGMSQFSDGGSFATKPYICGSSYILKMSDYKKGPWCDIVDGLYWQFIDQNREFFASNPRMTMMVKMCDRLPAEKKERIFNAANLFRKRKTSKFIKEEGLI